MSAENLGLMVKLLGKLDRVAEQVRRLNAEMIALQQRIAVLEGHSHG